MPVRAPGDPWTGAPSLRRRTGRRSALVLLVGPALALVVVVAALSSGPLRSGADRLGASSGDSLDPPGLSPTAAVAQQVGRGPQAGVPRHLAMPVAIPAGRPARTATLPEENRHSTPRPHIGADYVSAIAMDAPVLVGDVDLPWRWWISARLTDHVEEAAIHAGFAAWLGHPGSRWDSAFAGYTTVAGPAADGRSVVFLEGSCTGLTNANAYVFTDGGIGLRRYGASGTQIREADIGICPRIGTAAEVSRAVRHELGHVIGLGHQCDPGEACHVPGMGEGGLGCRVMFWQARTCQAAVEEPDLAGLRAIYPTIRPLSGPTRFDTAARASFALFEDGAAPVAVVVQHGVHHHDVGAAELELHGGVTAAAAALAARADGPLLLGTPDPSTCISGPGRDEVSRVLARRGTLVLVGDWPPSCRQMATDWEVALRSVPAADVAVAAADLARLGGPATGAVVVLEGAGGLPAAVALAAARDVPLLSIDPAGSGAATPGSTIRSVLGVLGGAEVTVIGSGNEDLVDALALDGITAQPIGGPDPVTTTIAVADRVLSARQGVPGIDAGPTPTVVLAGADAGVDGLVAAVVSAHTGGVLLLTPPLVDERVHGWLADRSPSSGWSVGGPAPLPDAVLAAYSVLVG